MNVCCVSVVFDAVRYGRSVAVLWRARRENTLDDEHGDNGHGPDHQVGECVPIADHE
uniref:Uncharacterized protein n=1 Tax=uncultured virus TaxID=340016 RepID=D5L2P9_9VIRU|nr:hypothetical protein [uncultured virus]